jgi:hypothetical protein
VGFIRSHLSSCTSSGITSRATRECSDTQPRSERLAEEEALVFKFYLAILSMTDISVGGR